MRKALIAVVVASALFAVGAFAASFAVQSENIASGNDAVAACAGAADVDFNEVFVDADNDWNINTITVHLKAGDEIPANDATDCVGADVTLVLQDSNDGKVFEDTLVVTSVASGVVTLTFDPSSTTADGLDPLSVADVWHSSILIDNLDVPTS